MKQPVWFDPNRRHLLRDGLYGLGIIIGQQFFPAANFAATTLADLSFADKFSVLNAPDKNGIRLPTGFTSRIVAQSGQNIFNYTWHAAPDGGAIFKANDGGWIYVSNSELDNNEGGTGALRFDSNGNLIDAYSILRGTSRNCAGGPTPWGSWLSCEEIPYGQVWECDPEGKKQAMVLPALGRFMHEAVAVDHHRKQLYLTEDKPDGCLYRFTPGNFPDLKTGTLEVAELTENYDLIWHLLPDPLANDKPTRYQVNEASRFNGGEGIWYHEKAVYFTTTGDNRVWAYQVETGKLSIIYNGILMISPVLTGVDNITASRSGELLVAEDGGDMQIVAITKNKEVLPVLQVTGQDRSEITGPAFSPDGTRLYFSSQRGKTGHSDDGITYEITGPF